MRAPSMPQFLAVTMLKPFSLWFRKVVTIPIAEGPACSVCKKRTLLDLTTHGRRDGWPSSPGFIGIQLVLISKWAQCGRRDRLQWRTFDTLGNDTVDVVFDNLGFQTYGLSGAIEQSLRDYADRDLGSPKFLRMHCLPANRVKLASGWVSLADSLASYARWNTRQKLKNLAAYKCSDFAQKFQNVNSFVSLSHESFAFGRFWSWLFLVFGLIKA